MIALDKLTKSYVTKLGRKYIFRDLSFVVPPDKNIALIGRNGAGKSTLMRLLCGTDVPDAGRILTDKRISWPVGLGGGYQGSLTGRQNVKFICRALGAEGDTMEKIINYVQDFAELGDYFNQPVKTYSSGMSARLRFGMSLAFDFDYYMVDEAMSVGDAHFRAKAEKEFKKRVGHSNLIVVTHNMNQVRSLCDIVLLLHNGTVKIYDDVEEGIRVYTDL
ncbi:MULTISPECIES: ABC transporter ATP-binding protein [unclassified Burkholderia]|uniref:ABC transporter ATP-binding protein n=1 Tax=unclassified Burkholderia TaxID=2613784 RepID=UPI000F5B64B4|nr:MULTISPECIES: ABC transporter ATP-binding protein [unclassified Burkholderia]RQS50951.1 ABC transporter ATP-binding protein [Burkholderia sp. Bp8989]RQS58042.1 ABC transporter ATP-binding protein [Burkholderia sp. Bp8984]